jgi:hypothetical protein
VTLQWQPADLAVLQEQSRSAFNGLARCLVTMCGLGPGALPAEDLPGNGEVAIDLLVVGLRRGGLADAQTRAFVGERDDSADLMSFESVMSACPPGVDALVEQRVRNRGQQVMRASVSLTL